VGLGEKIYGVPYTSEELGRLSVLSTQVTSSLRNIRLLKESLERKLFEEELKIARKIQTQLLPGEPPSLRGYELSAVTVPSRYVGGDYYDFVLVDDKHLLIVVADVSGKGIPASILTATLQAAVHSNVDAQANPSLMIQRLNNLLFRNTSAAEFATLFYAVVELETGMVRYANAGHDFPFVSGAEQTEQLTESGIVLGCMEDFAYAENEFEIPRGGSLVVYTDGVTDSQSAGGEYYGTERLRAALEERTEISAEQLCAELITDVRKFGTSESQDDLTLLVLRRVG
jgi:sigma-B regulation protein RsbU (phosphoserine phosphatase)